MFLFLLIRDESRSLDLLEVERNRGDRSEF